MCEVVNIEGVMADALAKQIDLRRPAPVGTINLFLGRKNLRRNNRFSWGRKQPGQFAINILHTLGETCALANQLMTTLAARIIDRTRDGKNVFPQVGCCLGGAERTALQACLYDQDGDSETFRCAAPVAGL